MLAVCGLGIALPPWASAQPYQVVPFNSSLNVADINNDLVAVGQTVGGVPFISDSAGVRLFPDLPEFVPMRINNRGVIAGLRRPPDGSVRAFQVRVDGLGYTETVVPSSMATVITQFTDSGLTLIRTYLLLSGRVASAGDYVWDGVRLYSVRDDYGVPSSALVVDIGEDGTVGGIDFGPFLKRRGEPVQRPWPEGGGVLKIGPAGHVVGVRSFELIMRNPDGSLRLLPGCNEPSILDINRAGEIAAACLNATRSRHEAHVFRGGQWVNLSDAFVGAPGEYLNSAAQLTDSGAVLAAATTGGAGIVTSRLVLFVPPAGVPTGVRATVNGRTVSLLWNPSPGANDYIVEAGSAPGLADFFNGSTGPQPAVTGTVPPGRYFVRVKARTASGVGAASQEIEINVP